MIGADNQQGSPLDSMISKSMTPQRLHAGQPVEINWLMIESELYSDVKRPSEKVKQTEKESWF